MSQHPNSRWRVVGSAYDTYKLTHYRWKEFGNMERIMVRITIKMVITMVITQPGQVVYKSSHMENSNKLY